MNVYLFFAMRTKCEEKQEALFEATVKLVNEIGFAASSVAKIAREARISAATIYIYYKNKEDLLVSTYLAIRRHTSKAILKDFDARQPIRDILEKAWLNMFRYAMERSHYFHFAEQFANSPYADLIDLEEVESYFEPIIKALNKGIDQKIIKNVSIDILKAFIYYPVVVLSNSRICKDFKICEDNMKTAFRLAWDAISIH
jgi:AcrR family transcriptional regulator